ncbi:t-SNARE coiled-coil-like proteiny domain-containing protein [Entamoeba marina]
MTDLKLILNELAAGKKKIDGPLSKLRLASKSNDINTYKYQHQQLLQALQSFQQILEKASSVTDDEIDEFPELNYSAKVTQYFGFCSSIESNIAPPPQQQHSFGTAEDQPLIGQYDDDTRLRDQSELITQVYSENTQEIESIVTKMKDLNTGFVKIHSLAEVQATQIDNIEANVMTADDTVKEGVEEIGKAQKYQKKASNKLIIILLVAGGIVVVLGAVVTLILVIKFAGNSDD